MATKRKKSTSSIKYKDLIAQLKLSGMGLDSLSVDVDRDLIAKAGSDLKEVDLNLSDEVLPWNEGFVVVRTKCDIVQRVSGADKHAMSLSCTFSAIYSCEEQPASGLIEQFSKSESRLIFWPYIRQLVADLTARMSVGAILLPLLTQIPVGPEVRMQGTIQQETPE